MKKTVSVILATCVGCVALSGCQPGQNTPGATVVGAAAGGLIGSQFFHGDGKAAGVIMGALIGGIVGNQVGKYMDRQDRANMQNAIIRTPVGQQASWTNQNTNAGPVTYNVRPVSNYYSGNRYCRKYHTTITIRGREQRATGHACRQPNGVWKIIN